MGENTVSEEAISVGPRDPPLECDLVMRGGITSGVVYPLAVCELAQRYRLRSIGGASAGAIAAGAAAAAEHGRASGGFEKLARVHEDVATRLLSLFQPTKKLAPLFNCLLGAIEGRSGFGRFSRAGSALVRGYWPSVLLGLLPGVGLVWVALRSAAPLGWGIAAALTLGLGVVAALSVNLYRVVTYHLPANGFGLCNGTSRDRTAPALTPWLTDLFDDLAAHRAKDFAGRPLTFGDLAGGDSEDPAIDLQVMTTCLAQARPYRIPFSNNVFMWKESDFRELFPARVVDWMIEASNPIDDASEYRWLPRPKDFPVVVAVRMSLSFPLLLSAVPLYARDFSVEGSGREPEPQLCWFSDGGICSNFPIHFFDSVWPTRPTFGITLDKHDHGRHGDARVWLPTAASEGLQSGLQTPRTVAGFLSAIIDSMQGWRDTLQSTLPGYRERIATVRLDDTEGGLNLTMPPERIHALGGYGRQAGQLLRDQFSFDAHRWRRHLVWMAELEELLDDGHTVWTDSQSGRESLASFLERYMPSPDEYRQTRRWQEAAADDIQGLMQLAATWLARPSLREGRIPRPEVDTRITPKV